MNNFKVMPNRCDCHPETCCCNDWVLVDDKGKRYATFYSEKQVTEMALLLNTKGVTDDN